MSVLAWVLSGVILASLLLYSYRLLSWRRGMQKLFAERLKEKGNPLEKGLSIVVPVRNEKGNWEKLLEDLDVQLKADGSRELIFVDDHSEDGSREAMQERCEAWKGVRVLSLPRGHYGKKRALWKGIEAASFERILTLDADVRLPPSFLERSEAHLKDRTGNLFLLPVLPKAPSGLWQHILYYEALALLGVLIGSVGKGRPVLANGAGMIFHKTPFLREGGYEEDLHIDSGDDLFMLHKTLRKGKKVEVLPFPSLTVRTKYPSGLREWVDQRLRWGMKVPALRDRDTIWSFIVLGSLNILLVLALFCFPFDTQHLSVWLISWGLKGGIDRIFLILPLQELGKGFSWKYFPLALLFYPFQLTLLPLLGLFHRPLWKGRRLTHR